MQPKMTDLVALKAANERRSTVANITRNFSSSARHHQAMNVLRDEDIGAIIVEAIAAQQRLHGDVDAVVLRVVATTLTSFGIDHEDHQKVHADFEHLRRWRRSVEQAQSYTFKAVITIIVTGLVAAVWLGVKITLGK